MKFYFDRMLICDGHDSHIIDDFIDDCMNNNILLMILSRHSSYLTQSLNIEVFSSLKRLMTSAIESLVNIELY